MVIDSSALAAILFGESDAAALLEAMVASGRLFMSSLTKLECSIVVEAWKGEAGARALAEFLAEAEVEVVAFDSGQAELALDAWRRYGKGRHPANLNMGDCASYALAKQLNMKLLYKGEDFAKTDVAR